MAEKQKPIDLSAIATSDLELLAAGRLSEVSTPALMVLSGGSYDTGEILSRQAERAATASLRGLSSLFGNDLDFYNRSFGYQTDLEKEKEARAMFEVNPVISFAGALAGSVADPTNLIPLGTASTLAKGAIQGAGIGGVSGFLDPIYEGEFDNSRLQNAAIGAGIGTVLGGGLGALSGYLGKRAEVKAAEVDPAIKVESKPESIDASSITEPTPTVPGGMTYDKWQSILDIERRVETGELTTPAEQRLLKDFRDTLPPLTDEAQQAYNIRDKINKGEIVTPSEQFLLNDFEKSKRPIFNFAQDTTPFVAKTDVEPSPMAAASVTDAGQISSTKAFNEAESLAFKTGDYRDLLTTSAVRFADIRPLQFERMTSKDNPYRTANINSLLSKAEEDQDVLSQTIGALQGRFKYEKQSGKSLADIAAQGELLPEDVALAAVWNRKLEEILPPEIIYKAIPAARRAIDDLNNARDLARVARDRGSEEAYAILQSMMSKASGFIASFEGNASNIGRALAYQKEVHRLIKENKELKPFLGTVSC